jgi:hypothetical protein
MRKMMFMVIALLIGFAYSQSAKFGGGIIMAAPAPEDTTDHKVYVAPVPACTVIVYPVIRENLKFGKNDKVRLILRTKPKDSSTYTELWQWDYKQAVKDSSILMIKANFIDK